jgi:hypothetical protein
MSKSGLRYLYPSLNRAPVVYIASRGGKESLEVLDRGDARVLPLVLVPRERALQQITKTDTIDKL